MMGAGVFSNQYHFVTRWEVEGTLREVSEILGDTVSLARWWPSVYLKVKEIGSGDSHGVGKVVTLLTKGWLPYTLRWTFCVTDSQYPNGFALRAWGDFVGEGQWHFRQEGSTVIIIYDWKIRAEKPLLRAFSFLLRPVFSANHRWAMAQGEKSLKLELARRRAVTMEERGRIPAAPLPTATSPVTFCFGVVATVATGVGLAYLLRKWRRRT
jgi:hypothetical protein